MLRIDAAVVIARVIDGVTVNKSADMHLERISMRSDLAPLSGCESNIEQAVAVRVGGTGPLPAVLADCHELGTEPLIIRTPGPTRHGPDYTTVYTEFIGEQLLAHLAVTR